MPGESLPQKESKCKDIEAKRGLVTESPEESSYLGKEILTVPRRL